MWNAYCDGKCPGLPHAYAGSAKTQRFIEFLTERLRQV
jgi:hypothetical protein